MEERKYVSVPLDVETHRKVIALCEAYDMGLRAQGALVRKLVNAEYDKLAAVKLIRPVAVEVQKSAEGGLGR